MTQDESAPLLGTNRVHGVNGGQQPQNGKRNWWSAHATLWLIFLLNLLLFTGQTMALAPRMQIYEDIVCQNFSSRDIDKGRCKEADVQAELAFVLGMEEFLTVFLSLLSIPYSFVAKKYGCGPVLSLSLCGVALEMIWPLFICTFDGRVPLYWVWLAIAFEVIGGGITVTVTMFNLVILDLVSQESRTHTFLYLNASSLVASALGQFASTRMMHSDVWLPAYIGCGLNILALALSFPLFWTTANGIAHDSSCGSNCEGETDPRRRPGEEPGFNASRWLQNIGSTLKSNPSIFLVLVSAFAFPLGEDSMFTVILLYISKRYGWSIGDANLLVAFSSVLQISTFLVFLPGLGYALVKYGGVTSYVRDRAMVQIEGILLLAGALGTALAPTIVWATGGIVIMSFGMAVVTVLRSLVTDLVRPQDIPLVYSMVTMMMRIGSAVAGPLFAWSFGVGLRLGPSWIGLPFTVASGFFLTGTIALSFLPKEPRAKDGEETDGNSGASPRT